MGILRVRREDRNALLITLSEASRKVVFFVAMLAFARQLGTADFGALSIALSIASVLAVLTDFGLNELSVRELARGRTDRLAHTTSLLTFRLLVGTAMLAAVAVVGTTARLPAEQTMLYGLVFVYSLTTSMSQFLGAVYRSQQRMGLETTSRLLESLVLVGILAAVATVLTSSLLAAAILAASSLTGLLATVMIHSRHFGRLRFNYNPDYWRSSLRAALPFGASALLAVLYFRIHIIMLGHFHGDETAGVFNAAYQLITGALLFPVAVAGSVFPLLSSAHGDDRLFLRHLRGAWLKVLALSLPLLAGSVLFARPIIDLAYGPAYADAAPVLTLSAFLLPFVFSSILLGPALQAKNKAGWTAGYMALNTGIALGLDLLLIPSFGLVGASVALVATEALGLLIMAPFLVSAFRVREKVNGVLPS